MNFKHTIAFLCILLLQSSTATHCADAPRALTFLDQAVSTVEQATLLPRVLAELVVKYDGERKFGLKKRFPAENGDCQQTVLACGLLACVARDGTLTTKNLVTNKIVDSQELFTPAEKNKYYASAITVLPNDCLLLPAVEKNARGVARGIIKIANIERGTSIQLLANDQSTGAGPSGLLLQDDELVVYKPSLVGFVTQQVFNIKTGKCTRNVEYADFGCTSMALLPDDIVAAAECDKVFFTHSNTSARVGTLQLEDCHIHSLTSLSGNRLAIAAFGLDRRNGYIKIVDTKTKLLLQEIVFPEVNQIDVVRLSEDCLAMQEVDSAQVGILCDNTYTRLPIRAKTIQGVPNGDLFVQGKTQNTLWGQSPDMSLYEQAGDKRTKKKNCVLM